MSSTNNRNATRTGQRGGKRYENSGTDRTQSRPNYKTSLTTDMISKKQVLPTNVPSSRRDSDSSGATKKSTGQAGTPPQNQILTTSTFYKAPPMQNSSVKRSPTQSKKVARKAPPTEKQPKSKKGPGRPPNIACDSIEVVSSKSSQLKDSDTQKTGREVSFGDKEQFSGKQKVAAQIKPQQSKLKVDKKVESTLKAKSPRESKGVQMRSEKVVESPRHIIENKKQKEVQKVASDLKLDKKDATQAKSTQIEYKRQDVVHNTIKDKVQLYRQTVESKDDSQKSDRKLSVGKQTNPLVLKSKPKNPVSKISQKIDQTQEKKDQSQIKKVEIEKSAIEPKVGQKRRYDQIKNIALDIEKQQKDEKLIEGKKDEKLIVNNQVKVKIEDESSKKRQKTKEVEEIDLMTPDKKGDIQMENLKDSNISISTDVENEDAQKMISAPQNSQNTCQNGGVLTQDDQPNVQVTPSAQKLSQEEITDMIKKYEQWRHLHFQDKQLDHLITNHELYDQDLFSQLRQNQKSMFELNDIISQTQDEIQLHTKWCLNFTIFNGSIYERQEAIKYSLENYYRKIGQF